MLTMQKQPRGWLLLLLLFSANVLAKTAQQQGLDIAQERKFRDLGWQDSQAELTMILRNAQGQESERKLRVKSLEIADDGDKALTVFDSPRDVKGTAFLSFSHTVGADDQWMYLPALKRVKRIASRNKSGPFMGSEFAFEDMTSFELEKYNFKLLAEENYLNQPMFVLQQVPLDKYSGYTKQLVWLDKDHYRPHKIEFYDRKNALLKVLTLDDYQLYLDKYWRPLSMLMVNKQTGKSTRLLTHNIRFKTGLKEKDFDKNSLKRAR